MFLTSTIAVKFEVIVALAVLISSYYSILSSFTSILKVYSCE